MSDTTQTLKLTSQGAMKILEAAIVKAQQIDVPQCISIVDSGGHLLAFCRMDGAFVMSNTSSRRKAETAAAYGIPTGDIPEGVDLKLAIVTNGERVNLPGGLPLIVNDEIVGAIGVGSGTGAQDLEVAKAGVKALEGAKEFY
ncbi:MAG: glcg protein [Rhodospirillaceae bacterium]|jgi:glc operon protein GlcG|nr:glcg protein [Rhodospirillaceae bacterium]MBI77981.1 glcg protein [Rhodospirillaceae bacterium]|tara:strand:- start:498 stop:923 length:426 start_codon:yes stop_codon:yes gene_type:complete